MEQFCVAKGVSLSKKAVIFCVSLPYDFELLNSARNDVARTYCPFYLPVNKDRGFIPFRFRTKLAHTAN